MSAPFLVAKFSIDGRAVFGMRGEMGRSAWLGSAEERSTSATRILTRRGHQARSVVRKAIAASAAAPVCGELRRLAETLLDPCMDDPTRSSAARRSTRKAT